MYVFVLGSFRFKRLFVLENILTVQILKSQTWSGSANDPRCLCTRQCLSALHLSGTLLSVPSVPKLWGLVRGGCEWKFHLRAPGFTSAAVLIFRCHLLKQVFQVNAEVVLLWKVWWFMTAGLCCVS